MVKFDLQAHGMKNLAIEFIDRERAECREFEESLAVTTGSVLLRSKLSVVSAGTELAMYHGTMVRQPPHEDEPMSYPVCPGYAVIGKVVEAGASAGVSVGERIFAQAPHRLYNVVDTSRHAWCRLPRDLSDEDAGLLALAKIGLTAAISINVRLGHRVLVIGLGVVGYFAAQWMRCTAALTVHGCDTDAARLRFASQRGIECFHASLVRDRSNDEPYDVVVEATGVPDAIDTALRCVREGGGVVLLGTTRGRVDRLDVTNLVHRKCVTIVGAHVRRHDRTMTVGPARPALDSFDLVLRYLQSGRLRVDGILGRTFNPHDAAEAYATVDRKEAYAVAFDWSRASTQ